MPGPRDFYKEVSEGSGPKAIREGRIVVGREINAVKDGTRTITWLIEA